MKNTLAREIWNFSTFSEMIDQMCSNMFLVTITVTDFLLGRSTFSNQTSQDASEYTQQEIRHCDRDHKHI
jgi:hypothetical protein